MAADASFDDFTEAPLRLSAVEVADLAVISALTQDAVCKIASVQWAPRRRRFSFLLYRFRWEDADRAETAKRSYERVAAALTIDDVMAARTRGIDQGDREAVFNLLSISFEAAEDGAGVVTANCSDAVSFEFDVECLNVALVDLTRPWEAGGKPQH